MKNTIKSIAVFNEHHKIWYPIVISLREHPIFFKMTRLGLLGERVNYDDIVKRAYNETAPRTY